MPSITEDLKNITNHHNLKLQASIIKHQALIINFKLKRTYLYLIKYLLI